MSFLGIGNKPSILPQRKEKKPLPNRFGEGFIQLGAVKHEPRTNSAEEIRDSIELRLKKFEERCEYPEKNLVNAAKKCGIDLPALAKREGRSVFDTASGLGIRDAKDEDGKVYDRIDLSKMAKVEKIKKSIYEYNLEGLRDFVGKMKDMPQRHLSVANDILDLHGTKAMVNSEIFPEVELDAIRKDSTGRQSSLLQHIFGLIPQISKENPAVLNLIDTVFSNSDPANAKFFLDKVMKQIEAFKGCGAQAEATEEFVPVFAETYLKGMPSMHLGENCKENQFYRAVATLCNTESKPENLKLLKKALDIADECVTQETPRTYFDICSMRKGDTEKIRKNMEMLPELLENAVRQNAQEIDVSGFLENNVNLD